jgi:branched-chain amino acid transport system permease protein
MHLPSTEVFMQVATVGFLTGGVYALMAAGLTLIFGVMKVINIAHGAFLILSAYMTYWLFTLFGVDPFLSVIITVPIMFLLGWLLQRGVLSRIRGEPGLVVLVTFALALALEGLMGTFWETTGRSVRTGYTGEVIPITIGEISLRLPIIRIAGFVAALAALLILWSFLRSTDYGRGIRATIQNRDAARLMGVNVERIQALTFGVGLATVAAGGALFSLIWTFNAGSHEEWISKLLAVIVLGGLGSLPGALIAALLMGTTESVAAVTMSSYISPIVFYLILFLTLIVRPEGLLGSKVREG